MPQRSPIASGLVAAAAMALAAILPAAAGRARPAPATATAAKTQEEFFILSSIDTARGRIVVKRPTEVTLVIRVTDRTTYRDEKGKAIRLAALRAGDTAFVRYVDDASGAISALSLRLAPMTIQELQRRYPETGRSGR